MSCAACQQKVEKAVSRLDGVTSCNVSLLTNSMSVDGSAAPGEIIKAVEDAGYGASPLVAANKSAGSMSAKLAAEEEMLADKTTPILKKRLIASISSFPGSMRRNTARSLAITSPGLICLF